MAFQDTYLQQLERVANQPLHEVYRDTVKSLGWARVRLAAWEGLPNFDVADQGWAAVIYRAGLLAAEQVEAEVGPAYHNRTHTAETLVAAATLVRAEYLEPMEARAQGLLLLAAMAAHDWQHGGRTGLPIGALEAHSATLFRKAAERFDPLGRWSEVTESVAEIILGTEFSQGPRLNAQELKKRPLDHLVRLKVLANEADVFASLMPATGHERGQKLAQECAMAGEVMAFHLETEQGRRSFLASLPLASQAAEKLGLPAVRDAQLTAGRPICPRPA